MALNISNASLRKTSEKSLLLKKWRFKSIEKMQCPGGKENTQKQHKVLQKLLAGFLWLKMSKKIEFSKFSRKNYKCKIMSPFPCVFFIAI